MNFDDTARYLVAQSKTVAGTIRRAEHGCNKALPPMPQGRG